MTLADTLEILRRMALFRALDSARLQIVAMSGEIEVFLPGERIAEKGERGDAAFVILEGAVAVLIPSEEGETRLTTLPPGDIVGELAVLTGNPRSTALVAEGALTMLRLERDTILELLREFPDVAIEMIKVIADRLDKTNQLAV
ncbi:MAG: cyclic nucleotide-binding domain-containing protein [Pseudomonadota bacterium]